MNTEESNPNEVTSVSESPVEATPQMDIQAAYGGRIVEKEDGFFTQDGVRVSLGTKDGGFEFYLAEGHDVGTRIIKEDEPGIPSGY